MPKPVKPKPSKKPSAKSRLAEPVRKANGHFKPGHAAPGPGRPRSGAPNGALGATGYLGHDAIRRALVAEQRRRPSLFDALTVGQRRELAETNGITPVQFLLSIMLDPIRYMDARIDAAKTLMPYFHRKMPVAIELPADQRPGIDLSALLALPRADREALLALLKRVGIDLAAAPALTLPLAERVDPDADA